MKIALLGSALVSLLAQSAAAQDGAYFGIGLGVGQTMTTSSVVPEYDASVTDFSLALTAGYRFASAGPMTYGIEGNLDLMSANTMSDSGTDACTGSSPSWCEIDAAFRLRGTLTADYVGGNRWTASLGAVVVQGRSENGGGNYLDTRGRGVSVGIAWERPDAGMPVRVDLNYDAVRDDNQPAYERELDMIGLRVSYMF
jgi:hypothetical protein